MGVGACAEATASVGRSLARRLGPTANPLMPSIGLIAGNGRFPFLVLKGARSLGHDVTVVAIKEEAFPDLEAGRAGRRRRLSLGVARASRQVHQDSEGCRRDPRGDGRAGQARQDFLRHHSRPDAPVRPDPPEIAQHRRADFGSRRRHEATRASSCIDSTAFLEPLLAREGVLTDAATERGRGPGFRVRLPDGGRHRRARHRPDDCREAQGRRRRRSDGRDRRSDRTGGVPRRVPACASSRWRSRSRICDSTCR